MADVLLDAMGELICPLCGCRVIQDEPEGHEIKDGDYLTPNSYVIDRYVYHCEGCGQIYKTQNEL